MLHSFISNKNKQQALSKRSDAAAPSSSSSSLLSSSMPSSSLLKSNQQQLPQPQTSGGATSRQYRYTTAVVYDAAMLAHECTCKNSRMHLETPERLESIYARICASGLDAECEMLNASPMASINDLLTCHNEQYALIFGSDLEQRSRLPKEYLQQYVMMVCMASCGGFALEQDQDNAWNEETTPTACRVAVGAVYDMARLVWEGKIRNGFALVRPPGSHAEYNRPLYDALIFFLIFISY